MKLFTTLLLLIAFASFVASESTDEQHQRVLKATKAPKGTKAPGETKGPKGTKAPLDTKEPKGTKAPKARATKPKARATKPKVRGATAFPSDVPSDVPSTVPSESDMPVTEFVV